MSGAGVRGVRAKDAGMRDRRVNDARVKGANVRGMRTKSAGVRGVRVKGARMRGADMDMMGLSRTRMRTGAALGALAAACAFALLVAGACPQGAEAAAQSGQGAAPVAAAAGATTSAEDGAGSKPAGFGAAGNAMPGEEAGESAKGSTAGGEQDGTGSGAGQADGNPAGDTGASGSTPDASAGGTAAGGDSSGSAGTAGADEASDTGSTPATSGKTEGADAAAGGSTAGDGAAAGGSAAGDGATAGSPTTPAASTGASSSAKTAATTATTTTSAKAAATSTASATGTATNTTTSTATTPKGGTRVLQDGHIYIFYSSVSGKNVEVCGGSTANKAAISQYTANYTKAQHWRVSYDANNYATFINVKTGKAIDVANGKAFSGATVWQFKANGTLAQKWVVTKLASGGYRITSALDPRFALDLFNAQKANNTKLWLYRVNNTAAQCWNFYDVTAAQATLAQQVKAYKNAIAPGIYTIATSLAGARVLDVAGGSTANGGNVQMWKSNGTQAQMWRVSYDSTGYMQLENVKSGKMLDVANASKLHGTNVWQWAANNSLAQKWVAVPYGDGTYKLVSALFPRIVLDVAGGSTANGANVNTFKANSTAAQRWKFAKAGTLLSNGLYSIASVLASAKALDLSGAGTADATAIQLWTSNKTYAQKWYLAKVATNVYTIQSTSSGKYLTAKSDGSLYQHAKTGAAAQNWQLDRMSGYYVLKNLGSGKWLDLSGANTADGTAVQTWEWNGTKAQRWQIAAAYAVESNAYFSIVSALSSNTIVGAAYAQTSEGTNVSLTTKSTYDTQKWLFILNSDKASYTIVNAGAGLALDVANGSAYSGANVQLWSRNSTAAQKWRVYWSAAGYFTIASQLSTSLRLDVAGASTKNETNIQLWDNNGTKAQGWRFAAASYNTKQSLRGIDIYSGEGDAGIDIWSVDADFIIVKVSQGTSYINPYWRAMADATLNSGKKLGLYHYAAGKSPEDEANFFADQVADYIGRAVLVIDWESEQNPAYSENGSWWTDRWRAQVKNRTGKTAWTYVSQSISRYYSGPLWIAQYANYDTTGYQDTPWNEGAYSCVCRQYTSQGDVSGYSGLLDLNKFYGSRQDWDAWAQGRSA